MTSSPPETEAELLGRAATLAGSSLAELAELLQIPLPTSARSGKGWVGQAIEQALGASAGPQAEPDFPALGVELKTLPIDINRRTKESTFVSVVPQQAGMAGRWQESAVYRKLQRILWIPVEAPPEIRFANRRIGSGFLWSPDARQQHILQGDWEELMEQISFGEYDQLSARQGRYLQIRPKAANSRSRVPIVDADGQAAETVPRGFYLRAAFTQQLLDQAMDSPHMDST